MYLNAKPFDHTADRGEVLSGENLGRSHHTRLEPIVGRDEHRRESHHRLAATDVALQQAIHLATRDGVLTNLADHTFLRSGQLERQFFVIETVEIVAHTREHKTVVAVLAHGAT